MSSLKRSATKTAPKQRIAAKKSSPALDSKKKPISEQKKSKSARAEWVSDGADVSYYANDGGHSHTIDNAEHKANIEQRKKKKQQERQEVLLKDCRKRLEKIPPYLLRRLCDEKGVEHIPDNTREDLIEKLYEQFQQEITSGGNQTSESKDQNGVTQAKSEQPTEVKLQVEEFEKLRALSDAIESLDGKSSSELQDLCSERDISFSSDDNENILSRKLQAWKSGVEITIKLFDYSQSVVSEIASQSGDCQLKRRFDADHLTQIFADHPKPVGMNQIQKILDQTQSRPQDVALLAKVRDYYGFPSTDDPKQTVSYLLNPRLFNVKSVLDDTESSMFFRFASWDMDQLTCGINESKMSREASDLMIDSIVSSITANSINIFALRNVSDSSIIDSIVELLSDVKQRQQWCSSTTQAGASNAAIIWQPGLLKVENLEWNPEGDDEEKSNNSTSEQLPAVVASIMSKLQISEGQSDQIVIPQEEKKTSTTQVVQVTAGTVPYIIVSTEVNEAKLPQFFSMLERQEWFNNSNIILAGNFGVEKYENNCENYLQFLGMVQSKGFFDHGLLSVYQTNIDDRNPRVSEYVLFKGNQSLCSPNTHCVMSKERFLQTPKFWGGLTNGNYVCNQVPVMTGFFL